MLIQPITVKGALRGMGLMVFALSVVHLPLAGASPLQSSSGPIVVQDFMELQDALTSANAGDLIKLKRGTYAIEAPLVVPDGVTLEGEGVMRGGGQPSGFKPNTVTSLLAVPGFSGDLLTLGDGVVLKGLQLAQSPGVPGNVVVLGSRDSGDSIAAVIRQCEIISPNPAGISPEGPIGEAVLLTTRNANASADPPAHEDAEISLLMQHSIVRSPVDGRGLFLINFGTRGVISASILQNRFIGGLVVAGGVSRGDQVSGAVVHVDSRQNVFSAPDPSAPGTGWQIFAGSSVPIPIPTAETNSNSVYFSSSQDRLEGFTESILAVAGNRYGDVQGPASNNLIDMRLRGLSIDSSDTLPASDLRLFGALSTGEFSPGDGNILRVLMRNVKGSGARDNAYANTFGPAMEENQGVGNRLHFPVSQIAFEHANSDIDPMPAEEFFGDSK